MRLMAVAVPFGQRGGKAIVRQPAMRMCLGRVESDFLGMSFDRGRRGRGRDKRDRIGEDDFGAFPPPEPYGNRDAGGGGGGYRGGGGGFRDGGDFRGGGGGGFQGGGQREGGGFQGGGPRGGGGGGGRGMPAQVVGEGKGVVKFFNAQKGFGFIQRDGGGEDVFVHISAVERAGLAGLAEGQGLEFTLVDRGGKVSASDLKISGDLIEVESRPAPPRRELTGERTSGTVKFFNSMKGFGFITRDDGQPDAFVHISAVERSGLAGLNEGDRIEFDLEVDRRGKYSAVNLSSI